MNTYELYDAITCLPDAMTEAAAEHRFKRDRHILRYAGIAAAAVLVIGITGFLSGRFSVPRSGAGSGGGDGGSYMHYVGPVLPMTVQGDTEGITVSRSVDYDFSPYQTVMHSFTDHDGETLSYDTSKRETAVIDRYVLTNTTDADKTLTLLYPAILNFNDALERLPRLTVDGADAETTLHAAQYSGGFSPAYGDDTTDPTARMNLEWIRSFDGYVNLFSDGRYQASAFAEVPSLDFPVTVYRIDGYKVPETDAVNPSLQISFTCDPAKTTILTYGSNGASNDWETKRFTRLVGALGNPRTSPMYLILCGEDITDYALQGYKNGGANAGEEIPITAEVTRYETTMDAVVRRIVDEHFDTDGSFHSRSYLYGSDGEAVVASAAERELLYAVAVDLLCSYGVFSDDPAERYSFGMLEDLFEAYTIERVLYQSFEVTVPAGGSVTVAARMNKEASYDFIGKNRANDTYELATQLGSAFTFDSLTASVTNTQEIEMLDNNFGFDPENGVTEATLDPGTEQYWMRVKKK